jgi:beta-glucosidase-like glycosyl hydrolase/CubicO group peptidase (beta-lactamase class C family)
MLQLKLSMLMGVLLASSQMPFASYQTLPLPLVTMIENEERANRWVDSCYNAMTTDERLGQFFMLAAYPEKGQADKQRVLNQIARYHLGGLIMFKGSPTETVNWVNEFQAASKNKMLISIDGEWGPNMRISNTIQYPRQLLLGAIQDNTLIYDFGKEVARQCRRLGINVNFAPVVDINNNRNNPVIGDRSFGENPMNVSSKGYQYMMGMQDHGVMACAKHFPGHGDTDKDSHHELPIINHNRKRLDTMELIPFRVLSEQGLQSIMVAHLNIPQLDNTPNLPSTLSQKIVQGILKDELNFKGLVITDAINMQGVAKHHKMGEADAKALLAGNDILLMSQDVPAALTIIKQYLQEGKLTWGDLEVRVKKILHAKYRVGLSIYKPESVSLVNEDMKTAEAINLKERLVTGALTLLKNPDNLIPLKQPVTGSVACINLGDASKNTFQREMDELGRITHYNQEPSDALLAKALQHEHLIISLHGLTRKPASNFGLKQSVVDFVNKLSSQKRVILVVFGNPYLLKNFERSSHVMVTYEDDEVIQKKAAQALLGINPITGRLPITASHAYKEGMGVDTESEEMPLVAPEKVGMNSSKLNEIDALCKQVIDQRMAPGCQVLVARNNKIVYHKAFGNHTYDNQMACSKKDLYDLASVTKICATTIAAMKLYDEGKLNLNATLGSYLPFTQGSNKENILIKDLLLHQAGLKAWIPFYQATLENKQPSPTWYASAPGSSYTIPVAERLYMHNSYLDSMMQRILKTDLNTRGSYVYSDFSMIFLQKVIESITGETLDNYVHRVFYSPMGLNHTTFNPIKKFSKEQIVPTEDDKYFRNQVLQGHVHDMASAMFGGVAGHAGLFSTAHDVAAIYQMLLDGGVYKDRQYLKKATIDLFTQYQNYPNSRRGYGFDKPEIKRAPGNSKNNTAWQCSDRTFGHTGFTGIGAWADPDKGLIFIFLSNRTYPSMSNNKLISADMRQKIQQIAYDAIYK